MATGGGGGFHIRTRAKKCPKDVNRRSHGCSHWLVAMKYPIPGVKFPDLQPGGSAGRPARGAKSASQVQCDFVLLSDHMRTFHHYCLRQPILQSGFGR